MAYIRRTLLFLTIISFWIVSCRSGDEEFRQRFDTIMDEQKGVELFNSLLALDQEFPDRLVLKVNIGGMLLAAGDLVKAEAYLKQGQKLCRRKLFRRGRDPETEYLLFTNLAELYLRKGEFTEGLRHAEQARDLGVEDRIGVFLTEAKCRLGLGEAEEALELFRSGWEEHREQFSREDLDIYAELLARREAWTELLQVFRHYEQTYGYQLGLGIHESAAHERLGRINEGILSAFKELEYQRYLGLIDASVQAQRLRALEEKLADTSWNPDLQGGTLVQGLKAFAAGRWSEAHAALESVELDEEIPFYRYSVVASRLESGQANLEDLVRYIDLEADFRELPGYYYHLWRGMKKNRGNYNLGTARRVMEKCILLAPKTEAALETRVELGRLVGLPGQEGSKILLGPELDAILDRLRRGSAASVLDPVMGLLSTAENAYQLAGMLMLRQALTIPAVRSYLEEKRSLAGGRLRERLDFILGPGEL
jgi:hypothetical protein